MESKYESQYISEGTELNFHERFVEIQELIDIELKREKWNSGVFPTSYENKIIFIYAKAFISALNMIGKLLNILCKEYKDNLPKAVFDQKDTFFKSFPQLKDVRDSLQHQEDRGRGLNRKGKSLDIKQGLKGGIYTSGTKSLVLNNLNGNKFGTTINDGQFVEIEISDQTMLIVQQCIQEVVDSFSWQGSASVHPEY